MKNVVAKTWVLPSRWNGRRYSDPAKVPAVPTAPTLSAPSMTSDGCIIAFSGGSFTTLIPQWSNDAGSTWHSLASDTSTPLTFTGLSPGNYSFRGLADGYTEYPTNTVTGAVVSAGYPAPNLFLDDFESGNMRVGQVQTGAQLNTINFQWDSNNRTSLVTMSGGVPTKIYENGVLSPTVVDPAYPGVVKNWSAKSGNNSLRFRHPANDQMAEQYYRHNAVPDLWVRYWIRVPVNFNHGSLNNKWHAFWTNVYDGPGEVTFQTRPYSSTPGGASLVVQDGGVSVGEVTCLNDFILVPRDRGRWMQIVYHLKPATSPSANNGVIQVWRRWQDEVTFTQIYNKATAKFFEGGTGIRAGYIMGWEQDPYTAETEFLLDDFSMSSASLVV